MAAGVDRDAGHGIVMADLASAPGDSAVGISGPGTVAVGNDVAYTITVTNRGLTEASGVQLDLPLPKGLAFVSNAGDCATAFPCALGALAPAASAVVTATYTVPLFYGGFDPIRPQPSVTSTSVDPVSANDTATTATTVTGATRADLAVGLAAPRYAQRGQPLVYQTTVSNEGPIDAQDVIASLVLPAEVSFVSNAGDCTTPFPCTLGLLPNTASRSFTTTVSVPIGYPVPAPIVATATVSTTTPDPDATNDSAAATSVFGAFFTLAPCRVADTRDPGSPNGPPALAAGASRTMTLAGLCGIPAGASAVALNVPATQAEAVGNVRLYPADASMPLVSTLNFVPGVNRANNAVVAGSADGQVAVTVHNSSGGSVEVILDVAGYFLLDVTGHLP